MKNPDSLHVNFRIAAEFREKVKRTREDFGQAGQFFSCELLRGIYDFPVLDSNYYEKEDFSPMDVILIDGRISMRTGRVQLIPISFTLCEGELMNEAASLIEHGHVYGNVYVQRDAYERREDGALIPRVECSGMGFVDNFVNAELFQILPNEKPVKMAYTAHLSLDTMYERRDNNLQRRNNWVLSGQRVEPLKQIRRPVEKGKEVA